ncbi:MAG TPA: ferredoxin reductase family protein [Candidatus Angelobacter sp.]|nr:ferredoxin reductase family protein [Candidatus Angelobacter sp.]
MSSGTATRRGQDVLRPGPGRAAHPESYDRAPLVALWFAALGLGLVIGIQLATRSPLSGPGALVIELSRWCALLGTYGAMLVVVLVARIPALERSVGLDRMVTYHRRLGPAVIVLIAAHVALVTTGYALSESVSILSETTTFLTTYTWVLPAFAGFCLMVMAGVTSWRVARRRMRYETWWVTHLYLYLAIALAYMHQVLHGQQFVTHAWARWIWMGLYVVTFGALLLFRVGLPVMRSLRHDLRVHAVVRESKDTVSVWVKGRDLAALDVRGGQFFGWRFLTPQMWWQSHPYSLSAGGDPNYLRITVKDLGDHSRSLARLRPGTRVVAEGPYGVFTADARHGDRVVLLAGGVGITPIRAVLDDLPPTVRTDVLFRAPRTQALILRAELDQIAATRPNVRVRYLVGNRRDYPIDARTLLHLVPDVQSADLYVCGPEDFIKAVREAAHVLDIPPHRVHHEAFSFQSPDTYAFEGGPR